MKNNEVTVDIPIAEFIKIIHASCETWYTKLLRYMASHHRVFNNNHYVIVTHKFYSEMIDVSSATQKKVIISVIKFEDKYRAFNNDELESLIGVTFKIRPEVSTYDYHGKFLCTGITATHRIQIGLVDYSAEELLDKYVFWQTGEPCGVKIQ